MNLALMAYIFMNYFYLKITCTLSSFSWLLWIAAFFFWPGTHILKPVISVFTIYIYPISNAHKLFSNIWVPTWRSLNFCFHALLVIIVMLEKLWGWKKLWCCFPVSCMVSPLLTILKFISVALMLLCECFWMTKTNLD